jgi:hypothetical protein
VLLENPPLQVAQVFTRLDPDLLDERLAGGLVRLQRVGLAAGAIKREHQLRPTALAQRMLGDECLELAHELGVTSKRQVGIYPVFQRGESEVLEANDLALGKRLEREVR